MDNWIDIFRFTYLEVCFMSLKIPDVITEQEFNLMISKCKKPKDKAILKICFYQCLRVTELINLKRSDVDLNTGFIHVKAGKGNKDRDIPIMKPAINSFRYLPIGISRQGLHKKIKVLGKKTLSKDLHMHTLRHSGATFYLNDKKRGIRFIQQLLGHSRLATTEIYTHINPSQLKEEFENIS